MKFTKLYFTREDLKDKLGIESHQFAIAEVKSTVDEVEFTLAIDDDAITVGEIQTGNIVSSHDNLRRFRLINGRVATYDFETESIKVTDNQGDTVFEASKDGEVKFNGLQNELEKHLNKFISEAKYIHSNPELRKAYTNEQKDVLMFGVGLLSKILEDGLKK